MKLNLIQKLFVTVSQIFVFSDGLMLVSGCLAIIICITTLISQKGGKIRATGSGSMDSQETMYL